MKTLTKEQVYVIIENQADCNRAIQILTKAGEEISTSEDALYFDSYNKYLKFYNNWYIGCYEKKFTQITIDELESILTQKIKKSELKMEIEDLKEEVSNLRETFQYLIDETKKVTIVHPPIWAAEPSTVIGKGTIEGEADKPQFEVGKVYKWNNNIFYCNRIDKGEVFGFGFAGGEWHENQMFSKIDTPITWNEATPEEWLKRLEEEYNRRGFKKGTKYKSTKFFNYELGECKGGKLRLNCNSYGMQTLCESGSPFIMADGKWAEIIEEPQSERYNMTKDQNAQIDCRMTECEFNNGVGHCLNISPAITLNDNKSFVCWSSSESEQPKTMTVEERDELAKPFNPDEFQVGTLGAFWDGDWDNAVDETSILTARLDKIVLGAYKPINRATCFKNFKPLKFD